MVPTIFSPQFLQALPEAERVRIRGEGGLDRALRDDAARHISWVLWTSIAEDGKPDHEQGSMFFLDCGSGPFAVTAGHVYEQFCKHRAGRMFFGSQLGNHAFDLGERLICDGSEVGIDIATFRITPQEIERLGKGALRGTDGAWPPPPDIGDAVFFGGFPKSDRRVEHCQTPIGVSRRFSMGFHSGMNLLTSFDERQITSRIDRGQLQDLSGEGLPPVGHGLEGMSGGPMLAPIYARGCYDWRLVGVVKVGQYGGLVESVVATRAHHILPNGRIQP